MFQKVLLGAAATVLVAVVLAGSVASTRLRAIDRLNSVDNRKVLVQVFVPDWVPVQSRHVAVLLGSVQLVAVVEEDTQLNPATMAADARAANVEAVTLEGKGVDDKWLEAFSRSGCSLLGLGGTSVSPGAIRSLADWSGLDTLMLGEYSDEQYKAALDASGPDSFYLFQ